MWLKASEIQVNEPCVENFFAKMRFSVMFHCCSFNATAHLPSTFPTLFLLPLYIFYFLTPHLRCPFSPLSSFPLYRLSTHWFHVLLLSFSILTCLAHFCVTVNWILYFHRSALALPTELYFSFFHLLLSR